MIYCANKNSNEYKQMEQAVGGPAAALYWHKNNGNPLVLAPNGEPSILYNSILDVNRGDVIKSIRDKAVYYTNKYQRTNDWMDTNGIGPATELDVNGEPLLGVSETFISQSNTITPDTAESGLEELKTSNNDILFQRNDSSVQYTLKAIDILQSDKAKQVFAKGEKAKWDLNKILTELAIPKEQKQLLLDLGITDREQLAIELASKYSYSVEINTAKNEDNEEVIYDQDTGEYFGGTSKGENTKYYSNLTVPGGTNYTENEISTPLIMPSIKGHAQFRTGNGIGWFRSDEQFIVGKDIDIKAIDEEYDRAVRDGLVDRTDSKYGFLGRNSKSTKTRRILEVQSDLFQKWRNNFEFEGNKYTAKKDDKNVWHYYKNSIEINANEYTKTWDTFLETYLDNADAFTKLLQKNDSWVTFFIKSIIQDSAKKGYEKVLFPSGNTASKVEGHATLEEFKKQKEDRIKELESKNQRLRDEINNQIELYEKLERSEDNYFGSDTELDLQNDLSQIQADEKLFSRNAEEVSHLKQELERVEIEGFGALKPIYNFYENTVKNILNKQFGEENIKTITDEYGNQWREIDLSNEKVIQQTNNILLQTSSAVDNAIRRASSMFFDRVYNKSLSEYTIPSINRELQSLSSSIGDVQWSLRKSKAGKWYIAGYNNAPVMPEYWSPYLDNSYQKNISNAKIKISKDGVKVLQKFADKLESRFKVKFKVISEEDAKRDFKQYNGDAGFYDPHNKVAYLVIGKATKDTAVHEIFTHPFLESIYGTDLYNSLLEEAKKIKGLKESVDRDYAGSSQDILDKEYIARAIDIIVKRKESSPKLIDLVYKFFAKMADFINDIFGKELVKVQSLRPNITLEQLTNYALYGRDTLAIDAITGIQLLDSTMESLTRESAAEAFKMVNNGISIEQFLKAVGVNDKLIDSISTYYYQSLPENYHQFVSGIHDTILSGNTVYFQRSNPEYHSTPETLAIAIKQKQLRGLKARLRVLEVRGTSTKEQISELETLIKTIEGLESDKAALEFIKYSKQKLNDAVKYLLTFETQRANGERINETNLMSLYQDFLKLFESSLSEMDAAEKTNGAIFSDLEEEMKNSAREELKSLKTSYSNLLTRFDILARYEFENMLGEISDRVNFTSKDDMLKDVYSVKEDVSFLKTRWLGLYVLSAERSSIPQLRALDKVISDIEEEIERKVDETGLIDKLKRNIKALSKVKGFSYSEFREKDENGKDTGYLVSPLKWGVYSIKKRLFVAQLNKKYNVDPQIGRPTENDKFVAYNIEMNKFLSENVERRLDNSYYKDKAKLSMDASTAMDSADDILRKFEHQFLNEYNVVDTSKMSAKQKELWIRLKKEKRDLASEYDKFGELKIGRQLEVAQEIKAFREKFADKLSFKQRTSEYAEVEAEKKRTLTKSEFEKWHKDNNITRGNDAFYKALEALERADYGDRYKDIMNRARAIEKTYRDPMTGEIDVDLMDSVYDSEGVSVKKTLDELYKAAGIEKRNYKEANKTKATSGFDKLAKFETTAAGLAMEARMQAMYDTGDEELIKQALRMREENFDLIEYVGWVPKRYYQKIVPIKKEHKETVPNAIWNDIDEESVLYNKNYKSDLAQNNLHPKVSVYDNKKAYDNIVSDSKKNDLYDTFLEIYENGYSRYSYLTSEDRYRMPQKEGSFIRSVSTRSGIFAKVKEALKQIFMIQEDESDYGDLGLSQYRADGSRLRLARTKYIQHIDNPAAIAKNLGELYSLFLIESIRFQEVTKAEGKINLFQHAFSKTSVNPEDPSGEFVKAGETTLIKKAEDLINRNVYDEKKDLGSFKIPGTNTRISITKPLFGLLQYAGAFINLAFNKGAIIANAGTAEINLATEAYIGMDITTKDLAKGSAIVAMELHNALADTATSVVTCKQTLINHFFGLLKDKNRDLSERGTEAIASNISDLIMFGGYTAGDYVVKSQMLNSLLLGFKYDHNEKKFYQREEFASLFYPGERESGYKAFESLKTSLLDILSIKDGKVVVDDEYKHAYTENLHSKVKSRADNLAARLDGILTKSSKSSLFSSALGTAVLLNRQWILNVWQNLFGNGVYSFKEQRDVEGMYITLAKYMYENNHRNMAIIKNIGRAVIGKERELIEKKQLTAKERDAIRRIQAQFTSVIILYTIAALLFRSAGDDEDSFKYMLATMILRTGTETSASVMPTDTWGFIQSPTAAKPMMDAFGDLYSLTLSGDLDTEVRSGVYKHESKAQQSLTKLTPLKHLKEDWISPDLKKKKTTAENQASVIYSVVNSIVGESETVKKKKEKKKVDSIFNLEEWLSDKKKK